MRYEASKYMAYWMLKYRPERLSMLMILPEERNAREVMWKLYFIDFLIKNGIY